MASRAFAGKSLYAEEEARERKAAAAAAAAAAEAAEGDIKAWREECARLRDEEEDGPGKEGRQLIADAAKRGDAEAIAALDRLAPISLDEFKSQRSEAARVAKADSEAREAERRRAERAARKAREASEVGAEEDEEDAELLSGLARGYKKRADGSTTSYFDRELCVAPRPAPSPTPSPTPSPRACALPHALAHALARPHALTPSRPHAPTLLPAATPPRRQCWTRRRRPNASWRPGQRRAPRAPASQARSGTPPGPGRRRT